MGSLVVLAANPASAQTSTPGPSTYGIVIRPGQCEIAGGPSPAASQPCQWDAQTAFSLRWTRDALTLVVGSTTLTAPGPWVAGDRLQVSAARRARVSITAVGGKSTRRTLSGAAWSDVPESLELRSGRGGDGWTIEGTIERTAGGFPADAVLITTTGGTGSWTPRSGTLVTGSGSGALLLSPQLSAVRPVGGSTGVSRTWTGSAGPNWSTAENWSPAGAPATGDALIFANNGSNRSMNNDIAGLQAGGVTVQDNNYTIGGLGLTLEAGSGSVISRDFTVTSLAGSGSINLDNGKLFVNQTTNSTFGGSFSGNNGQLLKQGSGTLTLTGNGTAIGRTEADAGLIMLSGGSLGPVYLQGGQFAMNGGTVASITGNDGQFGDAAAGSGSSGPFLMNNGTYLETISSATNFARLSVTGNVQFGGPRLTVQLLNGYIPPVGTTFIIIDNDGSDGVNNTFQGLQEGATVTAGSVTFRISYKAGTGNDVALTVTGGPTPTTADLTIAKRHTGDFRPGQTGQYIVSVSNTGSGATTGTVTVADTLPAGFVPTSGAGQGWACSIAGQQLTCTRADALAPNQSYPDLTIAVEVSQSASTATNVVTVSGGGETNTSNNSASDPTTVVRTIDLAITKAVGQAFAQNGQGSFTIAVRNAGDQASSGTVTVTDTLASDLTSPAASGAGWSCTTGGQTVTCTRSDALAPGQSYPTITLTATASATAPSSVSNTATVSGGGDNASGNNTSTVTVPIAAAPPDLTIAKSHADPFLQGQTGATFTLTVSNGGRGPTNGAVSVVDTLPAGMVPQSASGSGWTCSLSGQRVECSRSNALAAGQAYPAMTITVNVAANAASATNTATVSGGGDSAAGNNSASDAVTVTPVTPLPPPDLSIHKTHTGTVSQGGSVTFSIAVSNVGGSATAGEVVVTDSLPSGLSPTTAAGTGWSCTIDAPVVTCRRSDALGAGGLFPTIGLTASVSATATSTVNTASVSGGGDTTPGNNTSSDAITIATVDPDLTITKSHADPFSQGQLGATFTLTISNGGNGATSGTVAVVDTLPSGLAPTAAGGTGWTCTIGGQRVDCSRANALAAGQSYPAITVTVNVAADATSSANTASVSGGGDASPGNNSATDPVTVRPVTPLLPPDLTIRKTHTGTVSQGGTVVFSIAVSNVGGTPTAGEVVVTDSLPAGLTPSSAAGAGWSCSTASATVTCRRSDALAASAAYAAIALTASVSATAASSVNTVTVSGGDDSTPGNNSSTDPVTIETVDPDLAITKSHQGSFTPGQTASFTLTVRNVGAAASRGTVTVSDTAPSTLLTPAGSGTGWACQTAGQTVTCTRTDALAPNTAYPAITLQATVGADARDGTNTATVSGGGDTATGNNVASDAYAVAGVPNLTITKSHAGNFVQGQQGALYTIAVSNIGTGPTAGEVVVQDPLPTLLQPASASGSGWQCAIQGQVVTCRRSDTLGAHQDWPAIAIVVNVLNQAGNTTNVAEVSGGGDVSPADNRAADPTVIAGVPQLSIGKSHASPVTPGQRGLQFTIETFNNGSGPTTGVVTVTDALPAGLVPVDATGQGWQCSIAAQTATCSRSDALDAGVAYPQLFVTANVAADATSTINHATIAGGGDTTPADNTASDTVSIAPPNQPNLTIAKAHDGTFAQGQQGASYRLTVSNAGQAPTAGAVTVVDSLPSGLTPTAASGGGWSCGIAAQVVTCSRSDSLAPVHAWPIITVTVNVAPTATSAVNTATVSGGGDQTPGDNSASDATSVVARAPDLTIAKEHDDPFLSGQSGAVYRIVVSNIGELSTTGDVLVTDQVPNGLVPVGATGAGWACQIVQQTVTCRRSDALAAGAAYPTIVLAVNVSPTAASATNVVSVSGGGETNTSNDADSDFTSINASPDPTITLTLTNGLLVGARSRYVAQVTNLGPGIVGGVTRVLLSLQEGLTPLLAIGAGWTCDAAGASFSCARSGPLEAGGAFPPLSIFAESTVANVPLTARAQLIPAADSNHANNSAEVTVVPTEPSVALRLTHTPSTSRVSFGESVTYRIVATNIGNTTVSAATISAAPPRGFVFDPVGNVVISQTRSVTIPPTVDAGGAIHWFAGTIRPGEDVTIVYPLKVGAAARPGRQDNVATIDGRGPTATVVSTAPAIAAVDVESSTFSMLQAVVGRVFEDVDGDGVFTSADRPVANARIITSTGQAAITDPDGLYNIPSVGSGSVAVSLDKDTVPGQLTTADDRPGSQSWTRLIRTPVNGGSVLRQNFPLKTAEGRGAAVPPAVIAPEGIPTPEVMPEAAAGALPPRREYETRLGSSLLIALGEVSVGAAAPEFELFAKDGKAWGYGSVFYQGDLFSPKNRLTLAYDSHRRLNGTTDRDRLFELDPNDRAYPVFGDTSRRQEFATSNSKVFARAERGNSHVQWGDLVGDLPSSDRDGGRLSSYQRHLTGAEVRLANEKGDHVTLRGAQPTTSYARDTFPGTSLGLLSLSHDDVLSGTETIAVEVRDRRMPERIVSRDVLARGVDYQLDPGSGTIFLIRHISGLDSSLNLVQIVATYEHESAGVENLLFNGRAQGSTHGLRVGATFFTEQGQGDGRFSVAGIDLEQRLPRNGRLRLDLPYSRGIPSVDATVSSQPIADGSRADGIGAQLQVEQPVAFWNGKLTGSFLHADDDFRNPFGSTITPGSQAAAAAAELSPLPGSLVRVGAADERYKTTLVDASRTTVSGAWSQTIAKALTLTAGYDARVLDQSTTRTESGLATAAAAVKIGDRVEARVAREQNVRDQDDPTYPDQTTLGARVKVSPNASVVYTQRISDSAIVPIGDFTGTGFSSLPTRGELNLGIESRVKDTTRLTSRYQVDQGVNGADAFAVIGAVTQLNLGRGFSGTFGAEHGTLVSGNGSDYTSGTLGLAWLASDRVKASTRYEARERDGFSGLLTAGLAARLNGGLTGLVRTQWMKTDQPGTLGDSIGLLGALAIRPVTNDRAGLLLSYQYQDHDQTLQTFGSSLPSWRTRLSTDAYGQPLRRLELFGKLGWEQVRSLIGEDTDTYLGQGRLQFTLSRWVDAAIEERYIRQPATDSSRESTAAEIGFWPLADFRLGIGYSFQDSRDPYGRDLQGRAKGVYATFSTKLSRLFNLFGSAPPRVAP